MQIAPPTWTDDDFSHEIEAALELWRQERVSEPRELYLAFYDRYCLTMQTLLELSADLKRLPDVAKQCLSDADLAYAFRYLTAPAISSDDLKLLVGEPAAGEGLGASRERRSVRAAQLVLSALDERRFPWVRNGTTPSEAERSAAVVSTAALIASSRTQTYRRNQARISQEGLVVGRLEEMGMVRVEPRRIDNVSQAPDGGEFCGECEVAGRKADIVVRLWDGRLMPCECKVSNSYTNSIKRLNNDAAVKAETWLKELGRANVVPCAVLAGAFKLRNLRDAQERGLTIFWSHDLRQMTEFISLTKDAGGR